MSSLAQLEAEIMFGLQILKNGKKDNFLINSPKKSKKDKSFLFPVSDSVDQNALVHQLSF